MPDIDIHTILLVALATVSVAATAAGICFHAERFVRGIAGPAEGQSGRELIKQQTQKRFDELEADALAFRRRSQEEAWQGVAAFASGIAASAVARSPSGRAAQAEREHAAS